MLRSNQRAVELLDRELVGWLTTVAADGQPQSSAVWFVRDGDDLVVYSKPDATRMANLAANPRVAFNLRGDPQGDTIVTLEGQAASDRTLPLPSGNGAYVDKYAVEIARLFGSPAAYDADYSAPLRITITRIRAWG